MKLKTAKILSIILAAIQLFTVLLTALITLNQYSLKQKYIGGGATEILELKTIPVSAFCISVLPLIIYLILIYILFMTAHNAHKNRGMIAGSLLFLGIMLNLTGSYIPTIETMLVGNTMGASALASLSALNQAVTWTCTPFRAAAFALFCFVIGGYWGLQKEEA